jgi:hypothetical protein
LSSTPFDVHMQRGLEWLGMSHIKSGSSMRQPGLEKYVPWSNSMNRKWSMNSMTTNLKPDCHHIWGLGLQFWKY